MSVHMSVCIGGLIHKLKKIWNLRRSFRLALKLSVHAESKSIRQWHFLITKVYSLARRRVISVETAVLAADRRPMPPQRLVCRTSSKTPLLGTWVSMFASALMSDIEVLIERLLLILSESPDCPDFVMLEPVFFFDFLSETEM